jgi:hypothetical protein
MDASGLSGKLADTLDCKKFANPTTGIPMKKLHTEAALTKVARDCVA